MTSDAQPGAQELSPTERGAPAAAGPEPAPSWALAPAPPASGLPRLMDPSKVRFDLLRELRERQAQAEAQTQPADHARALAFAEAAIALAQELGAWPPSPELRFARLEGKIAMRKILNDPRLAHPPGPRA